MAAKRKPVSIDDILATVPSGRAPGGFERWMGADPERRARLTELIDKGRAQGKSFAKLVQAWNDHMPAEDQLPVKYEQVRLWFENHERGGSGKAAR